MSNDLFAEIVKIIKDYFNKLVERFGQSVVIYNVDVKRNDEGVEINTEFGNFLTNHAHKNVVKTITDDALMKHYNSNSIDVIVKEMISKSIVPKYQF